MGLELATDANYRATIRQLRGQLDETKQLLEVAEQKIRDLTWLEIEFATNATYRVEILQLRGKLNKTQEKLAITTTLADLMCFFTIIMLVMSTYQLFHSDF